MAIRVNASFVFTEDEFEQLSFEKQGDIIEGLLQHKDWDVEVVNIEMYEANMEDEWDEEE